MKSVATVTILAADSSILVMGAGDNFLIAALLKGSCKAGRCMLTYRCCCFRDRAGDVVCTILVVDDSPFIVDVFVTMLERGGYRSVAAYGGEECLDILKTVTPDLILLDIMMEPMDGWETLEKIKENPSTKEIPVLMLTAKQLTPTEAEEYGIFIEDYVPQAHHPPRALRCNRACARPSTTLRIRHGPGQAVRS